MLITNAILPSSSLWIANCLYICSLFLPGSEANHDLALANDAMDQYYSFHLIVGSNLKISGVPTIGQGNSPIFLKKNPYKSYIRIDYIFRTPKSLANSYDVAITFAHDQTFRTSCLGISNMSYT